MSALNNTSNQLLDLIASETLEQMYTDRELAELLGSSATHISKLRRRLGIKPKQSRRLMLANKTSLAHDSATVVNGAATAATAETAATVLRKEQDAAFEASLKCDQEKERIKAQTKAKENKAKARRVFMESELGKQWVRQQRLKYYSQRSQ